MFNGDNKGFDLINHAIRMGAVEQVLRRNDLLCQLNGGANPTVLLPSRSTATHVQQLPVDPAVSNCRLPVVQQPKLDRLNDFQFPFKLADMLDTASKGFEDIVSWQQSGESFRVHRPKEFVETVMPMFFKQTKMKSFQRQCNLYGFSRISAGPEKGGYRHRYFIRGQRHLYHQVNRATAAEAHQSKQRAATNRAQSLASFSPSNTTNVLHLPTDVEVVSSESSTQTSSSTRTARGKDTMLSAPSLANTNSNTSDSDDVPDIAVFPSKNYEMLEQSCIEDFDHIVSWLPGGVCFQVHDPVLFAGAILPRFFKHSKYSTFQRQLESYGFLRLEGGPNKGAYQHSFFQRGRRDLLVKLSSSSKSKSRKDLSRSMKEAVTLTREQAAGFHISKLFSAIAHKHDRTDSSCTSKDPSNPLLDWRQSPSESFSDWKIELKDSSTKVTTLHVHRRMLAVGPKRSEYFARQFQKTDSTNKTSLVLGDQEFELFPSVLDHMYNLDFSLTSRNALTLYKLAKQLEMPSMMEQVTTFVLTELNATNCIPFLLATEKLEDKRLLEATAAHCAEQWESLDTKAASSMDPTTLIEVMKKMQSLSAKTYHSKQLSLIVADCIKRHHSNITGDAFFTLTSALYLPKIDPSAAILLLAAMGTIHVDSEEMPRITCLLERCTSTIADAWSELRPCLATDGELATSLKSIPSSILFDILMQATDDRSSST